MNEEPAEITFPRPTHWAGGDPHCPACIDLPDDDSIHATVEDIQAFCPHVCGCHTEPALVVGCTMCFSGCENYRKIMDVSPGRPIKPAPAGATRPPVCPACGGDGRIWDSGEIAALYERHPIEIVDPNEDGHPWPATCVTCEHIFPLGYVEDGYVCPDEVVRLFDLPAEATPPPSDLERDLRAAEKQIAESEADVPVGNFYPDMPPILPGEGTDGGYTDRLTGADGTGRRPYDHHRRRQCSIGWHEECTDPKGKTCECPCHRVVDDDPSKRCPIGGCGFFIKPHMDSIHRAEHILGAVDDAHADWSLKAITTALEGSS